jgi:ubiquitin C-terminal hydrolase
MNPNDSKDLLNFLIETMHNELNELGENNNFFDDNQIVDQSNEFAILNYFKSYFAKNYHSILSRYLYGIYETITQCCNCQTMIYNFQAYNFLIFPLLEVKKYVGMCNNGNQFFNYQNYIINLNDCFNYYQKIDYFNGPNQIYCNSCNQLQDANYCNILYSTPTILSIVLNRGKNNVDFNEKFIFSTELSLGNFVKENQNMANYYLIGVICHVGDSSLSGHFFSYCRSDKNSPWYKYNDAIVSQCNENEFLNAKTPYILFYHKYT